MHRERFYTLSASCPDRSGIVARVSGFIAEHRGWILETALHAEPPGDGEGAGRYFMRVEIKANSLPFMLSEFRERFAPIAAGDSYNDTAMLQEAHAGILFRAPDKVIAEFPQFPVEREYSGLMAQIRAASARI